jgi:hypothetical protein
MGGACLFASSLLPSDFAVIFLSFLREGNRNRRSADIADFISYSIANSPPGFFYRLPRAPFLFDAVKTDGVPGGRRRYRRNCTIERFNRLRRCSYEADNSKRRKKGATIVGLRSGGHGGPSSRDFEIFGETTSWRVNFKEQHRGGERHSRLVWLLKIF